MSGRAAPAVDPASAARINVRIDRLPRWSLPRPAIGILGFAYFVDIYDSGIIGYTLPVLTEQFTLSSLWVGFLVTGTVITIILGAYLFASLADVIGRRRALRWCLGVLTLGSVATAFAANAVMLVAFRILTGFALGGVGALVTAYLAELSPSLRRGTFMSYTVWFSGVAIVAVPFVSFALVPVPNLGWRILFGLGALALLPLCFLREPWVPESPRWLAAKGRVTEAERIVADLEQRVQRRGDALESPPETPVEEPDRRFPTTALLRPPYLQRVIVVLCFWFGVQFSLRASFTFQPTILTQLGLPLQQVTLLLGFGTFGALVSYSLIPLFIDRFERKTLIAFGLVWATLALVLISATAGHPVAVVIGSLLTQSANALIFVPAYTYTAEIFPTNARATGASIGHGWGQLGGITQSIVLVAAIASLTPQMSMLLLGVGYVVALVIIAFLAIPTTGRSLTSLSGRDAERPATRPDATADPQRNP